MSDKAAPGDRAAPTPEETRLLDALTDHAALLDGDGRIIAVNSAWVAFGAANGRADAGQDAGASYLAVCDQAARAGDAFGAEVAAGVRAVLAGDIQEFRLTYPCHAPASKRWFEVLVRPLPAGDGPVRAVVLHANRTLLARTAHDHEGLKIASNEAAWANRAKTRFLAAASHDLRQPLMAARLFVHLLQERVTNPGERALVDRVRASVDIMADLFDALLDLSRVESGLMPAEMRPVDLGPLFARLADEFGEVARAKGLDLRVLPTHRTVVCDPVLLERILRNLLSNATRYTERGRILMGCRQSRAGLRIEVLDTGIGIAPAELGLIFEESYQAGNPERDRDKGYGLGLAIVRHAARMIGARVSVRSVKGHGSRFTVALPAEPPPAAAEPAPAAPASGERLVLVVEDDPLVALAMRLSLEALGCTVLDARCCDDAVEKVRFAPRPPDLVFADHRLPGGTTGFQAIAAVRALTGRRTPAVVVTGDVDGAVAARAAAEGMVLLHKPIQPEDLVRCLDGACRG